MSRQCFSWLIQIRRCIVLCFWIPGAVVLADEPKDYFIPPQVNPQGLDLTLPERYYRKPRPQRSNLVPFRRPRRGEHSVMPVGCLYDRKNQRIDCHDLEVAKTRAQFQYLQAQLVAGNPRAHRAATNELLFVIRKLSDVIRENFETDPESVDQLKSDIHDIYNSVQTTPGSERNGDIDHALSRILLNESWDITTNAVFTLDDLFMAFLKGGQVQRQDWENIAENLTRTDGAGGQRTIDLLIGIKSYLRARARNGECAYNEPFLNWLNSTSLEYGFSANYNEQGFQISERKSMTLSAGFPASSEWTSLLWKFDLRCNSWDEFRTCSDTSLMVGLSTKLPLTRK